MMQDTHDKNFYICERYHDIQERLQTEATNAEELDALKKFLASSVAELNTLEVTTLVTIANSELECGGA
eukprot:2848356-Pyramimonas_sp.AAC.1